MAHEPALGFWRINLEARRSPEHVFPLAPHFEIREEAPGKIIALDKDGNGPFQLQGGRCLDSVGELLTTTIQTPGVPDRHLYFFAPAGNVEIEIVKKRALFVGMWTGDPDDAGVWGAEGSGGSGSD
ncbi:MAG: hypothetical protein AAGD38_03675 [Acidobacteriota bacterium]